jgi:hypothetical protein
VQADELDPQLPELFEGIHELPETPSEAIVAVDDNGIHQPPPAIGKQAIQRGALLARPADPVIHALGHSPAPPLAVFPQLTAQGERAALVNGSW